MGVFEPQIAQKALGNIQSESLTDKSVINGQPELFIDVDHDKMTNPLTLIDSSIGETNAGIHEDSQNKAEIAELLRYPSTKSGDEMTRMKEGQNDIYYITGESKKAVENSPFLEKFKKGGYEGKKFVSATKEGLKVDDESESEEAREDFDGLYYVFKDFLGDKVDDVVVCYGFDHSPCSIVTPYDWTTNKSRKILKIYPENPITHGLRNLADADKNDKSVKELVHLLYDNAHFTSLCEERAWKLIKHN